MMMLARLMRACVIADSLPKDHGAQAMLADALRKDADDEAIRAAISACEDAAAELPLFDGLGLSFPDIVIGSRILGGETPKTKAMRENPDIDYETEFAKLGRVSETLAALCRASVRVRIINDGPMAAFSAAAELNPSRRENRKPSPKRTYRQGSPHGKISAQRRQVRFRWI